MVQIVAMVRKSYFQNVVGLIFFARFTSMLGTLFLAVRSLRTNPPVWLRHKL